MEDIVPMQGWYRLFERRPSKTMVVFGASDRGKSALVEKGRIACIRFGPLRFDPATGDESH